MKVKVNLENCELHVDKFATELAEQLKWKFEKSVSDSDVCLSPLGYTSIYTLCTNYSLIHEAERQVIEKVSLNRYGKKLHSIFFYELDIDNDEEGYEWNARMATASAQQRLTAMLLSLGVEEVEVGE